MMTHKKIKQAYSKDESISLLALLIILLVPIEYLHVYTANINKFYFLLVELSFLGEGVAIRHKEKEKGTVATSSVLGKALLFFSWEKSKMTDTNTWIKVLSSTHADGM